jgi:L-fuconolactonase
VLKIDAHQHFWMYNAEEYGWMDDNCDPIKRDFMPPDLKPLLDRLGFAGSIAVQARQTLGETRWLLELADRYDWIKGVVGWVDLCSENVEEQLAKFAAHPKLRGVRHVVHDEPDDGFMLRADFQRGISKLQAYGLTYDLLLFPRHLKPAVQLVEKFPEQKFVLDHISKPDIANGVLSGWKEGIYELASHPNVYCKLSGMVTEAKLGAWKTEDFRPFLDVVFDAFGTDRLMIGSDWPVCLISGEYDSVMGIVIDYVKALPEDGQAAVLGGNCAAFYGIV